MRHSPGTFLFVLLFFSLVFPLPNSANANPSDQAWRGGIRFCSDPGETHRSLTEGCFSSLVEGEDGIPLPGFGDFPYAPMFSPAALGSVADGHGSLEGEADRPVEANAFPGAGFGIRSDGLGFAFELAPELALTGALSFSVGKIAGVRGHLNGIFRPSSWEIRSEDLGAFPLYAGAGVILGGESGFLLGMRFPVGVEHHLQGTPLKVFLEFSPYFEFIRSGKGNVTFFSGSGSFGILYYF